MTGMTREGRSRRHLERLRSALRVTVDGRVQDALDWSAGGFALGNVGQPWRRGERLAVSLDFPLNNTRWGFDAEAEVTSVSAERIGLRFVELRPDQIETLHRMRVACISGHILDLDALLATPAPVADAADAGAALQPPPRPLRRLAGLALLALLGPALLGVAGLTLHDRIFTVRASHAAVTVEVVRVRMPQDGVVRRLALAPGDAAPHGAALLDLADDALLAEIEAGEADLVRHRAAIEGLRRRHAELTAFFADYVDLAAAEVRRAEAAVAQARQALALARREVERLSDLHATGHVAQARMDEALIRLAGAETARLEAAGALEAARTNRRMAGNGRYFTGSRVEGGEPARLAEEIAAAERDHAARSLRLAGLIVRRQALTVPSPCDCVVVAAAAQPGEWLRAGAELYLLRPAAAAPVVTAKVAHARARLLRPGDAAVVLLPDESAPRRGDIAALSHAVPPDGRFGLAERFAEDPELATVTVRLAGAERIPPGTPATVALPLPPLAALRDWLGLAPR